MYYNECRAHDENTGCVVYIRMIVERMMRIQVLLCVLE